MRMIDFMKAPRPEAENWGKIYDALKEYERKQLKKVNVRTDTMHHLLKASGMLAYRYHYRHYCINCSWSATYAYTGVSKDVLNVLFELNKNNTSKREWVLLQALDATNPLYLFKQNICPSCKSPKVRCRQEGTKVRPRIEEVKITFEQVYAHILDINSELLNEERKDNKD